MEAISGVRCSIMPFVTSAEIVPVVALISCLTASLSAWKALPCASMAAILSSFIFCSSSRRSCFRFSSSRSILLSSCFRESGSTVDIELNPAAEEAVGQAELEKANGFALAGLCFTLSDVASEGAVFLFAGPKLALESISELVPLLLLPLAEAALPGDVVSPASLKFVAVRGALTPGS